MREAEVTLSGPFFYVGTLITTGVALDTSRESTHI